MHRLMVMFLSLIVLALPVNALSVSVNSSSSPASNQSEITSSHGGLRPNESPLGQRNVITVNTDHAAIAERLASKSKNTSAFWDDFYNTATVSMGVYATPRNSPQYKKLYNSHACIRYRTKAVQKLYQFPCICLVVSCQISKKKIYFNEIILKVSLSHYDD